MMVGVGIPMVRVIGEPTSNLVKCLTRREECSSECV